MRISVRDVLSVRKILGAPNIEVNLDGHSRVDWFSYQILYVFRFSRV